MESNIPAKRVADSEVEQVQAIMPNHLNGAGRVFGGQLAAWIDVVGGIVARRHSNRNVTTAAIDNLQFKEAVYANSTVVLHGKITYVVRTSMEVRVDSFVESLSGERKLVNTAYLVEVALDDQGNPTAVPGLILENFQDRAEWEAGEKRRELRHQRHREAF